MTRACPQSIIALCIALASWGCASPPSHGNPPVDTSQSQVDTAKADTNLPDDTGQDSASADTDTSVPTSDSGTSITPVDNDHDGHSSLASGGDDCDDQAPAINPSALEICDLHDNDCNGLIDDLAQLPIWWLDRDNDGFGDAQSVFASCQPPPSYSTPSAQPDCNDLDPLTYPSALEVPGDGIDQDCDGVDACYVDHDFDGQGQQLTSAYPGQTLDCSALGEASVASDCDDNAPDVYLDAPEHCGAIDHDCDLTIGNFDPDVPDPLTFYRDNDADTFGNPDRTTFACIAPDGFVANDLDCNDDLDTIHPHATETCNLLDDDCDKLVDDADDSVSGQTFWYADRDADTYGNPLERRLLCAPVDPFLTTNADDCDDLLSTRNPGETEVPGNPVDENCDDNLSCFVDVDGDGAAGSTTADIARLPALKCDVPGYASNITDCLDDDPDIIRFTFYRDADNDTWGVAQPIIQACHQPYGFTTRIGDCDDLNTSTNPDGIELPGDARDSDCNQTELCFIDLDGDKFGSQATTLSTDISCLAAGTSRRHTDCNDQNAFINPQSSEVIGDGVDQDCDTLEACFVDADQDGAGRPVLVLSTSLFCTTAYVSPRADDCDDDDGDRSPTLAERCNQVDDDCDLAIDDDDVSLIDAPTWYPDADGDLAGDRTLPTPACLAPPAMVSNPDDCDDSYPNWQDTCPWHTLALGTGFTCGRRSNGLVDCVGTPPLASANALDAVHDIDADGTALCVIYQSDETLDCWSNAPDPRTQSVPSTPGFTQVAMGPTAACALTHTGSLTCWGDDSADIVSMSPTSDGYIAVDVAATHACALLADGSIVCWGSSTCPLPVLAGATQLSTHQDATCIWTPEGQISCDGCSPGPADNAPTSPLISISQVVLRDAACGLSRNGSASCWSGPSHLTQLPQAMPILDKIDVASDHACGIGADGTTICWGSPTDLSLPGPP